MKKIKLAVVALLLSATVTQAHANYFHDLCKASKRETDYRLHVIKRYDLGEIAGFNFNGCMSDSSQLVGRKNFMEWLHYVSLLDTRACLKALGAGKTSAPGPYQFNVNCYRN